MDTKKELRKKYLELRKLLNPEEVQSSSLAIFENFRNNFPVESGDCVHVFQSIAKFNEVDTSPFIDYFRSRGARIFVPKISEGKMISLEWTEVTVMTGSSWGIMEPEGNLDSGIKNFRYVITPLLYSDGSGNRVGYGKGYYDSFFSSLSEETLKIGVALFPPEQDVADVHSADIPLDYLLLTDRILSFKGLL